MSENSNDVLESRIKTSETRIEELFIMYNKLVDKSNDTAVKISSLETQVINLIVTVNEMKCKIDKLTSVPADNWNNAIKMIIATAIGVVVTYYLKR